MALVGNVKTFAAGSKGSAPDSITTANGTFFVEYSNGANSQGGNGSSTIVQYDKAGHVETTYTIPGSVDGLKFNPYTGQIWALQNQDGNSTLTLIDPVSHKVTGPLSYANPSASSTNRCSGAAGVGSRSLRSRHVQAANTKNEMAAANAIGRSGSVRPRKCPTVTARPCTRKAATATPDSTTHQRCRSAYVIDINCDLSPSSVTHTAGRVRQCVDTTIGG